MTSFSPTFALPAGCRRADGWLIGWTVLHAAALWAWPSAAVVGILLWWNANTVSHQFIHRPWVAGVSRGGQATFSAWLSILLGFPQEAWRRRHLAHHSGAAARWTVTPRLATDTLAAIAGWVGWIVLAPDLWWAGVFPGFWLGQLLCALHGYFEHGRTGPETRDSVSYYGPVYNRLFFNDGYHAEHHARPAADWRDLPRLRGRVPGRLSRWPPVLRFCDGGWLDMLERLALRSERLQTWLVNCHERAVRRVLADRPLGRVAIVGGGLFPRTALVLRRIQPGVELVIVDANARHLARAEQRLGPQRIRYVLGWFADHHAASCDLVVLPLALRGRRDVARERPRLVHDWCWHWRDARPSALVSWLLLKRVVWMDSESTEVNHDDVALDSDGRDFRWRGSEPLGAFRPHRGLFDPRCGDARAER